MTANTEVRYTAAAIIHAFAADDQEAIAALLPEGETPSLELVNEIINITAAIARTAADNGVPVLDVLDGYTQAAINAAALGVDNPDGTT